MGQEFHVIRCCTCQSFQVQQVKKINKWSCKLCGQKQTLMKEFGRGSGSDCRRHVQKLNAMRGAAMEEQEQHTWSLWKQVEAERQDVPQQHDQVRPTGSSRWSKYLDTPEEAEPEEDEVEENVLMDRQQLHRDKMIDRSVKLKRKRMKDTTESWRPEHDITDETPEQTNWSSLEMKPVQTSMRNTSAPSENHTSPPRKKSGSSGSVSRWACFLRSDCQEEGEEPSVSGRSQPVGGAESLSCCDIISGRSQLVGGAASLSCSDIISGRSQPVGGAASLSCSDIISQASSLPASSMFDSGEDFSLDF
ncbi:MRN complex-interacting protein isoform X2 [Clinocottus analis]|uniref:MRN complex-interacting protein isoform X2 n=1 Tax=Clinocottus analis TaxID=304258 RepID=UPI0035C05AAD